MREEGKGDQKPAALLRSPVGPRSAWTHPHRLPGCWFSEEPGDFVAKGNLLDLCTKT